IERIRPFSVEEQISGCISEQTIANIKTEPVDIEVESYEDENISSTTESVTYNVDESLVKTEFTEPPLDLEFIKSEPDDEHYGFSFGDCDTTIQTYENAPKTKTSKRRKTKYERSSFKPYSVKPGESRSSRYLRRELLKQMTPLKEE
ncbi:hypothetical protein Bhyg_08418, partial [Pseudolycoriella hygida]